ncbi:helix-turn-helix transcriptional regulator [Hydrogenophaga sp.]|uniref:helix-turn-helix transcriptional regulator n=1 Tax=Hydrogenophaga sp. TaxID=1904254 RepID=UPI0035AF0039
MDQHDSPRIKFIPRKRLQALTGLSRSSTYNRTNPRSESFDPTFPKPVNLSAIPSGRGPIGFVESEVYAWMEARVNAARTAANDDRGSNYPTSSGTPPLAQRSKKERRHA